jgi:hypothetical protein
MRPTHSLRGNEGEHAKNTQIHFRKVRAPRDEDAFYPTFPIATPLRQPPTLSIHSEEAELSMSSPTKRRSQRTSASVTPRRSARGALPPSSPAPVDAEEQLQAEASQASQRGSQATPRNSRLQSASTQSPLFFRSSPGIPPGSGAGNDAPESDDGGATPRASGMNIGGMYFTT